MTDKFLAEMEVEDQVDVKMICSQIGHLFKEGRKITVTITERSEDADSNRAD